MTTDLRTRHDADIAETSLDAFFGVTFPALVQRNAQHLHPWLGTRQLPDLTFQCGDRHWRLSQRNGGVVAAPGAAATGPCVKLDEEEFSGLVNDQYTPMTFLVGGTLNMERGGIGELLDWWLVLRALIDARTIGCAAPLDFPGLDGQPLDLRHGFHPDDAIEQMRHFLQTAGFLHIKGLFSEQEMTAISADIDANQHKYQEGDNKSWWATTKSGERRLVRLQAFDQLSQPTAALLQDPRFLRLGDITGDGHRHSGLAGNAIEALIKPLDVVKGISDLPWHKDCSLGRHSYECCSLTVGVSITGAGPDSGQLRVIAGSHRVLMWPSLISDADAQGLPIIDLPTQTGDVTLHLSCTHHMAQAPTARERRVLYTSFRLPHAADAAGRAARERISRSRESAYKNVSQ